jgi:hypothetical protein
LGEVNFTDRKPHAPVENPLTEVKTRRYRIRFIVRDGKPKIAAKQRLDKALRKSTKTVTPFL